jgi:hypothetical protein
MISVCGTKYSLDYIGIRADPSSGDNGFNGGINSAILRYVGAPEEEPIDRDFDPRNELKESDLHVRHIHLCNQTKLITMRSP